MPCDAEPSPALRIDAHRSSFFCYSPHMAFAASDLTKLGAAFAAGGIIGALIGRRRRPKRTLEGAVIGSALVGGATLGALAIAGSLGSAIGQGVTGGTITPAQAALTATALLPVVAAKKIPPPVITRQA